MMRFDTEVTRAKRHLNDEVAAFREIWNILLKQVIQCTWLVVRFALMNSYNLSEKDVPFGSTCLKNQSSGNQNLDDVRLCKKIRDGRKSIFGQKKQQRSSWISK